MRKNLPLIPTFLQRLFARANPAMQSIALGLLLAASCLPFAGCDNTSSSNKISSDTRLKIVCTTTMIADLATQIAGDRAIIQGLMRSGEDPHVYEVRPHDADLIADADLVLINGLHLEATLQHLIEEHAGTRKAVIPLAEDPRITPLKSQQTAGAPDPHCWFNVAYFHIYAQKVRDALCQADPANAPYYQHRAESYLSQLSSLDTWVRTQLASIPRKQRVMVTSHDAFQYLGQAYDIDVYAVIGISTEQQPRPQDIEHLEQLVRTNGVRALFIETSVSKMLNDIVSQIAANTHIRVGGTLFSDSLDAPTKPAGTYIGMVKHNIETITKALQ